MRRSARRSGAAALLMLLSSSCSSSRGRTVERVPEPAPAPPAASTLWPVVFAATRAAADSGAYAEADSALRTFSEQFIGTPESAESMYWRALLLLDPQNPRSSTTAAAAALDAHLAGGEAQHRFGQVTVLRRAVGLVDSLRIAAIPKPPPPVQRDTLLDQALERLRAELAVTKTELERIKRRLATPRP